MSNIRSYDSRRPLSYYQIGEMYSFYGFPSNNEKRATEEQIRKYSYLLQENSGDEVQKEKIIIKKPTTSYNRFYGVVVDKIKPNITGKNGKIVILCCGVQNENIIYLQKSYTVSSSGCSLDNANIMSPSMNFQINSSSEQKKSGGITKAAKKEAVGGITHKNEKVPKDTNIGGITRTTKVGGITKAAPKVGGITIKK